MSLLCCVRFYVVLVTVMPLRVLLGPARIHVLLPLLGGLCRPLRRRRSILDHRVFFAPVALARHIHETGVHQFAGLRQQPAFMEPLPKEVKEFLEHVGLDQRLPEIPDRVGSRGLVRQRPTDELLETQAVTDLILRLFGGQIVKSLHDERLEHFQPVVRGPSARSLGGLVQRRVQQRSEQLPGQHRIQAAQGVALGQQPLHAQFHVEETGGLRGFAGWPVEA